MSILDYSVHVSERHEMPIIYATPEERRRGGWLARAEGRVKTKGVPIGPRPASTMPTFSKAESASCPVIPRGVRSTSIR